MSSSATTLFRGLRHPQQSTVPGSSGLTRTTAFRPRAASTRQDSADTKPVDVSKPWGPLRATIGLAAGVLLSAQAAHALPQSQPCVDQPIAPSVVRAQRPVSDLALESLGEAVRGTNEAATQELKKNAPPSAPAAAQGAKEAAQSLKQSAPDPLNEPTAGGTSSTSPVSMVLPSASAQSERLTMQLAGIVDDATGTNLTELAKPTTKLDTGAGFKRSAEETKQYTKELVDKAKNSRLPELSPGDEGATDFAKKAALNGGGGQ